MDRFRVVEFKGGVPHRVMNMLIEMCFPKDDAKDVDENMAEQNMKSFVAFDGDTPVVMFTIQRHPTLKTIRDEVHNVCTNRDYRGKGLMYHFMAKHLPSTCFLRVYTSNKAAVALYEKLGFVRKGPKLAHGKMYRMVRQSG